MKICSPSSLPSLYSPSSGHPSLAPLPTPLPSLPEAAPTDKMLTQILQLGRVVDQLVHLINNVQLLLALEVPPRQLLRHPVQHLERPLVLLHLQRRRKLGCAAVGSGVAP